MPSSSQNIGGIYPDAQHQPLIVGNVRERNWAATFDTALICPRPRVCVKTS